MIMGFEFAELASILAFMLGASILAGLLAGLLGVGGGIIFVPVLYFFFLHVFDVEPGLGMMLATATSLACMIPTSIAAAMSQYRRGNVDLDIIKKWSLGMLAGVAAGSAISSIYGGTWLAILFGSVMTLNALNTLFRAKAKPAFPHLPGTFGQQCIAFSISCFSVMLGIGGGTLTVPTLNACSVEPHRSVGTSSGISLFVCIPGALFLFLGNSTPAGAPLGTFGLVNFLAAAFVIPFSVLAAPYGVRIGKMMNPVTLKRIFAIFLLVVSVRMLASGLGY